MKRDPHKQPIPLTGDWKYAMSGGKRILTGSFWFVAQQLFNYRRANRLPRASFEQAQMDVLVARRKEKNLTLDLAEPVPIPQQMSPQQKFLSKYTQKRKGGCRSCGR